MNNSLTRMWAAVFAVLFLTTAAFASCASPANPNEAQNCLTGTPILGIRFYKASTNTVYVASYHTNVGHYSDDQNFFATAGVDNPPLHALQDGISGADGVFAYGSSRTFPNSGYKSSNYWVDVVLQ